MHTILSEIESVEIRKFEEKYLNLARSIEAPSRGLGQCRAQGGRPRLGMRQNLSESGLEMVLKCHG